MTWRSTIGATLVGMLAACASPSDPSPAQQSLRPSEGSSSHAASQTARPTSSPDASVEATASPTRQVSVDELARTTVENLSVRTGPALGAARLGLLVPEQITYVVAGPVEGDGYAWYQLASLPNPYGAACESETPPFQCTSWVGWAAGITPAGDRWLEHYDPDCPRGRDTATYLSLDPATRLACAGDDEWRLVAYVALPGGRGCMPVWLVDPMWMDPSCSFFFPQPVERQVDEDTSLRAFIPPELDCGQGCDPWDRFRGSWVEVVGHLDDPVAQTCTYVLNSSWFAEAPFPPPDKDLAVFGCRLGLVVTGLIPTTPPAP